jgi:predicted anti-sigma-YlaC factor YlaD
MIDPADKLNCKQVSRLISEGLEKELPSDEQRRLRLHYAICEACRNVEAQMSFLRRAMRRLGRDEPPEV